MEGWESVWTAILGLFRDTLVCPSKISHGNKSRPWQIKRVPQVENFNLFYSCLHMAVPHNAVLQFHLRRMLLGSVDSRHIWSWLETRPPKPTVTNQNNYFS